MLRKRTRPRPAAVRFGKIDTLYGLFFFLYFLGRIISSEGSVAPSVPCAAERWPTFDPEGDFYFPTAMGDGQLTFARYRSLSLSISLTHALCYKQLSLVLARHTRRPKWVSRLGHTHTHTDTQTHKLTAFGHGVFLGREPLERKRASWSCDLFAFPLGAVTLFAFLALRRGREAGRNVL